MEEQAVRGVPWTLVSYAGTRVVTLLTLLVLARLLTPADFGIVALATLVIGVLGLLKDLGLGGALIVLGDLDRRATGTILTLIIGASFAASVIVAAAAPIAAEVFRAPRLTGVLAALAAGVLIQGFAGFYEFLLQRELLFRQRFYGLLAQSGTYAATSISLAAAGAGVWSIVVGQLAALVVLAGVFISVAPYRVAPSYDRATAASVLRVGRGFLLQGGIAFLRQNTDYVVVGRILGVTDLGYYSMSYRLAELPNVAVADPVARVTFPAFARARGRSEDIRSPFLGVLRLLALVVVPLGVLLSACAEPLTLAVMGEKWRPIVGLLAIFGLWAAIRPLETTIGWLLNSVGEADILGRVGTVLLLALVPGLALAATFAGTEGVAWGMIGNEVVSIAVVGTLVQRRVGISGGDMWRAVRPAALAGVPAWLAARAAADVLGDVASAIALMASAGIGLAVFAALTAVIDRSLLPEAVAQLRRMLARGAPPRPSYKLDR